MSRPKGTDGPLPRYQNSFAFRHNPKSRTTLKIAAIPATSLCCRRCTDIIEWKKKYRKYKPLTKPGKCTSCLTQGSVKLAYHMLCQPCAKKQGYCSKCGKPRNREEEEEEEQYLQEIDEQIDELANTKGQIPGIPERERRSLLRKLLKEKTSITKGEQTTTDKDKNSNHDDDDDDDDEAGEDEDDVGVEEQDDDDDHDDDDEHDDDNDDDDNEEEEKPQNSRPNISTKVSTGTLPSRTSATTATTTTSRSSVHYNETSVMDDNYTRALGDTNIFAQAIKDAKRKEELLNSGRSNNNK